LKVLAICQYYYPENFTIYKVCEQMVKDGYDVTVLTAKPNYGFGRILEDYKEIDFEVINGVKIHRLTISPRKKSKYSVIKSYLSFWHQSKKWAKKHDGEFDAVYSMSLSPVTILAAGNIYKKKNRVKHIVHCVDLWPESVLATKAVRKHSLVYGILYWWSKSLYKRVDTILIGSPSYEEYFRKILKLNNDIKYVPQCSLIEDAKSSHKYGEGFNILYCGNIGLIQGVENIPYIVSKLNNAKVVFHIIGMGPKSEELKENIKKYNVENNVIYYGRMSAKDSSSYYGGADAVYISLNGGRYVGKTIPNKLEMAMCFGKPVIGVLDGDGRKVIEDSKCGVVCSNNVDNIIDAINKMANLDKKELSKMSINGKEYYKENFDIAVICKEIEGII